MPHTVREWMSTPVVVVDPDSSVSYALTLMRRRNIHSVIVDIAEGNSSYGIVTRSDIRDKILVAERNPAETTVREIMSGPLVVAHPEWTLKECSKVMQKHKVDHLPVTDESGALVGLISSTDIFTSVEEQGWDESK
jgi:CBS domain-containing protein